ncbi:AmmeMemoRadiSam system protein B [bacterium]|nr:AmmeMemoRadiSam system protein B [bacterium]
MNKNPEFAGTFYPEKSEEIINLLNSFKQRAVSEYKSKAIIVPHAGMYYSGPAAMAAFQQLELNENIFIIAPSHHCEFKNIVLPKYTYFDTPLGSVEVNNRRINEIANKFPCTITDEPFNGEHSIEVILPFLQNVFSPQITNAIEFVKGLKKIGAKLRIIPILVGKCDYRLISDLISEYCEDSSFIISSDLSHYYSQNECKKIDTYTATIIETGKLEFLKPQQACGITGIMGLIDFANKYDSSLIRVMLYNSGDITNDKQSVVGYGSWFLYPDNRNEYIEKYHSKYVMDTVKNAIVSAIKNEEYVPHDIPPVLTQYGATFVTLKLNGSLRGCIGSVFPTKPLILDIIDNSINAGFNDSRFEPISERELPYLEISVSILSSIEKIEFRDERDLLSKIYPFGVILSEYNTRAVYLPEVWEQLPNREIFLNSLKEKAGLSPRHFSKAMEAYKFTTTVLNGRI